MCELDGDHSNGKLLFSCRTVVGFDNDGAGRKATPEDRLRHQVGCSVQHVTPGAPTDLFEGAETWVKAGNPSLSNSEVGLRIVDELKKISP